MLFIRNNFLLTDVMNFNLKLLFFFFHWIESEIARTSISLLVNRKFQLIDFELSGVDCTIIYVGGKQIRTRWMDVRSLYVHTREYEDVLFPQTLTMAGEFQCTGFIPHLCGTSSNGVVLQETPCL